MDRRCFTSVTSSIYFNILECNRPCLVYLGPTQTIPVLLTCYKTIITMPVMWYSTLSYVSFVSYRGNNILLCSSNLVCTIACWTCTRHSELHVGRLVISPALDFLLFLLAPLLLVPVMLFPWASLLVSVCYDHKDLTQGRVPIYRYCRPSRRIESR
jgi:hypothetical protein